MSKENTDNNKKVIDAANRSIGRVATEAADALRGKDSAFFERNRINGVTVEIVNASYVHASTRNKMEQKVYVSYSGYPGGQKKRTLQETVDRKGYGEAVRKAVFGMLPKNKLRPLLMKRLSVSE